MLFQNFEGKLVSHSTRMGFVLLPLGMCQKSLLRPPAALELSESFRSLIWRINLGGLLTWISLVAGIFDLSLSSDTSLLPREGKMHSS